MSLALVGCVGGRQPTRTPTPVPYIGPDAAALRVGQQVQVRMRVACVDIGPRDQPTYLRPTCHFEGFFFRLVIPDAQLPGFVEAMRGPPEERLVDEVVDATGVVQQNGRWTEIVLTQPSQLRIATGWRPPQEPTRLPTVPPPTPLGG